jgi:hypothetical protein
MNRDKEIVTARKLAEKMSAHEAREVRKYSRDYSFIEVYASMIVLGEAQ